MGQLEDAETKGGGYSHFSLHAVVANRKELVYIRGGEEVETAIESAVPYIVH